MKLGFLRPLYVQTGGNVSVYLDTSRAHENAPAEIGLRWRAARQRLADDGADDATLGAVEAVITDPAAAAPGRAAFGHGGATTYTAPLPAPPRREIARVAPLPHAMPLLAQSPPMPPHVRVTASLAGGEYLAVTGTEPAWTDQAASRDWPLHKSPSGGWSQLQHQRSTEEAWDENAKELAARVTEAARRTDAAMIVVGGDVRARQLLLHHLSRPQRAAAAIVEQEEPPDSPAMAQAAARALAGKAERECRERFDEWEEQLAHGSGAEGLTDTLTALADGQVSELFVADRPTSTATACIGPGPAELAATEQQLRERGVAQPVNERADAAIVRAAAATDAELRFLPEDLIVAGEPGEIKQPREGICAILRYPPSAVTHR